MIMRHFSTPQLNLTLASIIFSICAEPSMIVIPWSGFLLLKLVTLVNELDLDNSSFWCPRGLDSFLIRLKVQFPSTCNINKERLNFSYCLQWQFGLSSFQGRDTKLARFLYKINKCRSYLSVPKVIFLQAAEISG